jgi:hypothetical protein
MRRVKLIEHICSCLRRRLTSRIGGWSDGRRRQQGRSVFCKGGSRRFCRASLAVLAANSSGTGIVRIQARRFPDSARRAKRPDANFCSKVSATRVREKERPAERQKNPTPESNSNLFPRSAQLPPFPLLNPNHTTKHRQYAYLQGGTLFCLNRLLQLELLAVYILELESPCLSSQLNNSLNP